MKKFALLATAAALTLAVSGLTEFTTEQAYCEYQLTAADKK